MKKITVYFLIYIVLFSHVAFAQVQTNEQAIAAIKAEGMQHSQIMDTLGYVTDVFGPRLTNSPNLRNTRPGSAIK